MNVTLSRLQVELHEAVEQVGSETHLPSIDRKWILEGLKQQVESELAKIKVEEEKIADEACL